MGAARDVVTNETWQKEIETWMDEAQIIVIIPGLTAGLGWELSAVERRGHLPKLLILMPPPMLSLPSLLNRGVSELKRAFGAGASAIAIDANLALRWQRMRQSLSDTTQFRDLPEHPPPGVLVLHLDTGSELTIIAGSLLADESAYEVAVRAAVYGMFCGPIPTKTALSEGDVPDIT